MGQASEVADGSHLCPRSPGHSPLPRRMPTQSPKRNGYRHTEVAGSASRPRLEGDPCPIPVDGALDRLPVILEQPARTAPEDDRLSEAPWRCSTVPTTPARRPRPALMASESKPRKTPWPTASTPPREDAISKCAYSSSPRWSVASGPDAGRSAPSPLIQSGYVSNSPDAPGPTPLARPILGRVRRSVGRDEGLTEFSPFAELAGG